MVKVKKISLVILICIFSFFSCGCGNENANDNEKKDITGTTTTKKQIISDSFDRGGTGVLQCRQEASAGEGIDVDLNYRLTYKNGNILELVSIQKVTSNNGDSLDLYEKSYHNISDNYKDLEYYYTEIVRDSNSVSYTSSINYDKIDIKKLLDIEGEEDNIIKGNKAKLTLWLDLAGSVGVTCEEV